MSDVRVNLVRRWGQHDPGQSVTVDQEMARWLVGNCFAEREDAPGTASAGARAPGSHGADPRAGGDISRGGGMQTVRGGRHDGEPLASGEQNFANRAAPVAGSPKAGNTVGVIADAPEQNDRKASGESRPGDTPAVAEQARMASGESQSQGATVHRPTPETK